MNKILLISSIILCLSQSIIAKEEINDSNQTRFESLSKLTQVIGTVEKYYVDDIKLEEIVNKALKGLMQELQQAIEMTENSVDDEDLSGILRGARKLGMVANNVNSAALTDVVNRLESDCRQGLVDNISIAWPSVKRSLNNSLRVIYSHLNG